jgi:hypothetical protein
MQQYNMFYKQTLNKFHVAIIYLFLIYTFNLLSTTIQPSNDFTIPYLFYTNKPM